MTTTKAELAEFSDAWEASIADRNARIEALAAEVVRLREALEQLLDDMGEDGLCVCEQAKDEARQALAASQTVTEGQSDDPD
ncbi:MAG: hypothetical protein M3R04_01390 [bacterium]|nr:hypothetical protein [bacterium]